MADIMDLLKGQLSEGLLDQLTQQIGAQDRQQTATAAEGIVETLMAALAKNSRTPEGAGALSNALDKDHDGSILDDVAGYLGGSRQAQNTRMTNGAGILKHVLGGNAGNIADMIGQLSGLQGKQAGSLMATLAPLVLGALGKQKRQSNLDQGGLADILGQVAGRQQQRNQQQRSPLGGLINNFLDKDGDGSVIDDVAGMLGKFMRRKK